MWIVGDAHPNSLTDSTMSPKRENNRRIKDWAHFLACSTSRVEGRVGAPRWGLGRMISKSITHTNLHKPKQQAG
jgi:hypothetical protein